MASRLYLIEILHQTTTYSFAPEATFCCILSKFYIKPQHFDFEKRVNYVVSYRNSTSNHNSGTTTPNSALLYLIEILHQTTTEYLTGEKDTKLYLIEILHQTTTRASVANGSLCCILSKFYIKPQRARRSVFYGYSCILSKFYIKPQLISILVIKLFCCILSKFYIKPQPTIRPL